MHTFSKDQLITPWTMRKSVQEGNAQKLTNLSIWMHLSQKKIHLTTLDFRKDFLLLCIHKKKTTLPILSIYICWMYIFTNLGHIKTPDFAINQLQRNKGKFSSWKQKWFPGEDWPMRGPETDLVISGPMRVLDINLTINCGSFIKQKKKRKNLRPKIPNVMFFFKHREFFSSSVIVSHTRIY